MEKKKCVIVIVMLLFLGLQLSFAKKREVSDYNLRKAYELLEEYDYEGAMDAVNAYIEEAPESAGGYLYRTYINMEWGNHGDALADINKAISLSTRKDKISMCDVYIWRAEIYTHLQMYHKAIEDYDTAYKLAVKGKNADAIQDILYESAEVYYIIDDNASADAIYYQMLKNNEADQTAMVGLIRNMIDRKEYQEAIELADICAKYDDSYQEIYRFRYQAYDALGDVNKAIDDVITYIDLCEEGTDYTLFTDVLLKRVNYTKAKIRSKINEDRNGIHWYYLLTDIYEWTYDFAGAIGVYNQIENEFGESVNVYYYRSICYYKIGDFETAISDITKCLDIVDGQDFYALAERADYYRELGMYDEAIDDFAAMIELEPTNPYPYYKIGWCYELKGEVHTAMQYYTESIDMDGYAYSYLMRGSVHRESGDVELANMDFEKVLERDTVAHLGSCRHYALHFLGQDKEAEEWMAKIVENSPNDKGVHYDKACLYSRMGKIEEAISALRIAFEKGYRSFKHIENDDDMDNIRNHPDFIELINEYKSIPVPKIENQKNNDMDHITDSSEIPMKKVGGVYEVDCAINNLPLKFIFDTGASSVSISSVEASFMLKNGYLSENDIKGKEYYSVATGEIREGTIIRLREIRVGDAILKNVEASVAHNQKAPLLLGQSVLERFGTITIDNKNSKLIIKQ